MNIIQYFCKHKQNSMMFGYLGIEQFCNRCELRILILEYKKDGNIDYDSFYSMMNKKRKKWFIKEL